MGHVRFIFVKQPVESRRPSCLISQVRTVNSDNKVYIAIKVIKFLKTNIEIEQVEKSNRSFKRFILDLMFLKGLV